MGNLSFDERFAAIATALKNESDQSDLRAISKAVKQLRFLEHEIDRSDFARIAESSQFGRQLLATEDGFPIAVGGEELSLIALLALLFYKENRFALCGSLLHAQLFGVSGEECPPAQFDALNSYLFYKRLRCIERMDEFDTHRDSLFLLLKQLQLARATQLYAILLVFIVRSLFNQKCFGQLSALLRHTNIPFGTSPVTESKLEFYRGLVASMAGRFAEALDHFERAANRCPPSAGGRGARRFRALIAKHSAVLCLLLGRSINRGQLAESGFAAYARLVHFVIRGQTREFEELIAVRAELFKKDSVAHVLRRMHVVVLQNALKKLATSYASISSAEAKRRLGVDPQSGFDILAFAAKSHEIIGRFSYDVASDTLSFEGPESGTKAAGLHEQLLERIHRLDALGEQAQRGLRYDVQEQENEKQDGETESGEVDLDAVDFEELGFDD